MKKIFFIFLIFVLAGFLSADSFKNEILSLIRSQEKAWNKGSFEEFMAPYLKSDKLTFQSGNKKLTGWDTLLAMYKTNYAGKKRGTLHFSDIVFRGISKEAVLVTGRWNVTAEKSTKSGLFTLIFRRISGKWKIIHDHSS